MTIYNGETSHRRGNKQILTIVSQSSIIDEHKGNHSMLKLSLDCPIVYFLLVTRQLFLRSAMLTTSKVWEILRSSAGV